MYLTCTSSLGSTQLRVSVMVQRLPSVVTRSSSTWLGSFKYVWLASFCARIARSNAKTWGSGDDENVGGKEKRR